MESWFGKIEINGIENIPLSASSPKLGFIEMTDRNINVVHYPDCQQLLIWLTQPGSEYSTIQLKNKKTGKLVDEWPVTDKLSGSTQLVWDTLSIKPGSYWININWKDQWIHRISIIKHKEGEAIPEKGQAITEKEKAAEPIIYKDGFGKIIPDEDLLLRKKAAKEIIGKFTRHIEYEGNFRAGSIIYIEDEIRFELYHEMGGGNCMFYIDIPTEKQWTAATNTALSRRKDILEFIAQTVQAQQASNCNYEIKENTITYYYK